MDAIPEADLRLTLEICRYSDLRSSVTGGAILSIRTVD